MAESADKIQVAAEELRDEMVGILAELVMNRDALKFGKFPIRANKSSPYQLDIGALSQGRDTFTIGRTLALGLQHHFSSDVDICFGVPGKGIVMATIATFYYAHLVNPDTAWAFPMPTLPRPVEETVLCGAELNPDKRVVIIDDVLSDGIAVREAIEIVKKTEAKILGVLTLIDRRDRTKSNRLAANDIERDTGVSVYSCATIADLVRKMPESYLSEEKRELVIKHVTVETGLSTPLLPPFNKLTGL